MGTVGGLLLIFERESVGRVVEECEDLPLFEQSRHLESHGCPSDALGLSLCFSCGEGVARVAL